MDERGKAPKKEIRLRSILTDTWFVVDFSEIEKQRSDSAETPPKN
jgi:hypothetical protein